MKRIAIIGANGQVGSEVCLLLSMMPGVEVVPVCRTEIGSAFLRRCGLAVRHASATGVEGMRRAVEGCDVVADFSLPVGAASEVRKVMGEVIPNLVNAAPPKAAFVYLSSITAFGIPDFHQPLKTYRFSRNVYGSCKRVGEQLAASAGANSGRSAYLLRVGVVHGELQMVSRKIQHQVATAGKILTSVPGCESYAVFVISIAEALVAVANGGQDPGLYTMLPAPGVRWNDLHEWYCRRAGVTPHIELLPPDPAISQVRRGVQSVVTPVRKLVFSGKDLIAGYLATASPNLENQLRAIYHAKNAAREIAEGRRLAQYRPYGNNHTVFPGRRFAGLSESLAATDAYSVHIRETLKGAMEGSLVGGS